MLYTHWFFKDQYGKYAEKKAVFLGIPDSGCPIGAKKMYKKPYGESKNSVQKQIQLCNITNMVFKKPVAFIQICCYSEKNDTNIVRHCGCNLNVKKPTE